MPWFQPTLCTFTYKMLFTISAYLDSYVATNGMSMLRSLLCNNKSMKILDCNKHRLVLHKITFKGFVSWCHDSLCASWPWVLAPFLLIKLCSSMTMYEMLMRMMCTITIQHKHCSNWAMMHEWNFFGQFQDIKAIVIHKENLKKFL